MNTRWVRLAFVLGTLTGGAAGVLPLRQAEAGPRCPPVCLDDECTCVAYSTFDFISRSCVETEVVCN